MGFHETYFRSYRYFFLRKKKKPIPAFKCDIPVRYIYTKVRKVSSFTTMIFVIDDTICTFVNYTCRDF